MAVSLSLLAGAGWQFFDDNGNPLSGGLLYTYEAGTTTPLATYTDGNGNVANANPIVLDAAGRVPYQVWLTSGGTYKFILQTSLGITVWTEDDVPAEVDFAALAASSGSSLIGFLQSGAGAVARTVQSKLRETVTPQDFGAIGDGVANDTTAFQNFVNACSSNSGYGAPLGYIPAGRYKITSTINFPNTHCNLLGAGMWQAQILCDGVTGSVFKPAAISLFKPTWSDFAIVGNSSSGIGIDLSAVTSDVFDGSFSNLYISVGGDGIYGEKVFSIKFDTVLCASANGHGFRLQCGPAVTFVNCYAISAGTGKAGYRLAGEINLIGCNGVDNAEWWGVFGNDSTSADGFQSDFSAPNDYPVINMIGCNVEYFGNCGIQVQNQYKMFSIDGGKIDRNALSTNYIAMILLRKGPLQAGAPALINVGAVFKGAGVPNGGAALTNAWLYVKTGQPVFVDQNGTWQLNSITSYYSDVYAGTVPITTIRATNEVYQDSALTLSALTARRVTMQMVRYATTTLTPVGAGQAIDVTGYTKVIVTPAAAASITTATFTQTIGAGLDYLRNGDLIIEAGNANLTVNHSASGANTFRMAGAANVTMTTGQVLRFCWSSTSSQWVQV